MRDTYVGSDNWGRNGASSLHILFGRGRTLAADGQVTQPVYPGNQLGIFIVTYLGSDNGGRNGAGSLHILYGRGRTLVAGRQVTHLVHLVKHYIFVVF